MHDTGPTPLDPSLRRLPRAPNLGIQLSFPKVIVIAVHTKRVFGKQPRSGRSLLGVPVVAQVSTMTTLKWGKAIQTYTVKQSHMKANATGLTVALTSSGIGGVSPLAIL